MPILELSVLLCRRLKDSDSSHASHATGRYGDLRTSRPEAPQLYRRTRSSVTWGQRNRADASDGWIGDGPGGVQHTIVAKYTEDTVDFPRAER